MHFRKINGAVAVFLVLHKYIHVYRYLVTCTDYFSKWPEACGLPSKSADGVAHFLHTLIMRFGCFQVCISDQGREFVNEVNQRLFDRVGIEHRISSAYHPQTNGLDERMNQTVTKALIKYVETEEDDWDEYLDAILFSYRTSIHASTKYTPFFLMFGREAVLPIELQLHEETGAPIPNSVTSIPFENKVLKYVTHFAEIQGKVFSQAHLNIQKAQSHQKLQYDRRHCTIEFKVGDLVLKRNMRNIARVGGRKQRQWSGPYIIHEVHKKGYSLRQIGGKVLSKKVNTADLKLYNERPKEYNVEMKGDVDKKTKVKFE